MSQKEFVFFDDESPSLTFRKAFLDPTCKHSPYHGFIGNSNAVRKLIRLDVTALGRFNHRCNDLNIALIGRAGCGKTDLVRRHTQANGLPLVEIHPKAIKEVHDIFLEIERVCETNGVPLYIEDDDEGYIIPPINIFIDEVHALSNGIVQSLLKATEPKDCKLVTEHGIKLDCSLVHWIIATTDRGKLFDAFDTRFSKIYVSMYSKEEIAEIIKSNYPHWTIETCELVSHYCSRIPREALAFAKEMELEYTMDTNKDWKDIAAIVAEDNDIDEFGMSKTRVAILKAVSNGPISAKRLPVTVGVKTEELENFILPYLLEGVNGSEPCITVTSRGYTITPTGMQELDKRNIPYPK